jgi:DNA-binding response OmpR family regulator
MNILVADHDPTSAQAIVRALQDAAYTVVHAQDGAETLRIWQTKPPDLIVLDVELPDMDGFAVCRRIRTSSTVPVMLLTERTGDEDVVHGFEIGADDYVFKPYSIKPLVARIGAVLRRSSRTSQDVPLALGSYRLDTHRQALVGDSMTIQLTPLECRLLHYLLSHRGQIAQTDAILNYVWGYAGSADRAMLKQLIYRLRHKIGTADQQLIETVPGVGYTIP